MYAVVNVQLSSRELECLKWAANGKTYRETAAILHLSYGSIKTYLDTSRYKLNAMNVTHAVAIAVSLKIIEVDLDRAVPYVIMD